MHSQIDYHKYAEYRKVKCSIKKWKARLVAEIMRKVKPYFWETGYLKEHLISGKPEEKLNAFFFDKEGGYKVGRLEVIGFTDKKSVALDAYAGGLLTQPLTNVYIEDLLKIHVFVHNRKELWILLESITKISKCSLLVVWRN